MTLRITVRENQGVTILDLNGRLVLGEECSTLRQRVRQMLEAGKKKILLNMAGVNFIDSAGVGTLVATYTSTQAHDAQLKLAGLTQKPQQVLQVTRLLTVFDTFDDEASALASFS